jgi:hypothetical protein
MRVDSKTRMVLCRNILRRVGFSEDITGNDSAFIEYSIKDGERPEQIADRIYGDPEYHWIVLLANEITDPYHGWYKSDDNMQEYLQKKYQHSSVYFTTTTDGFLYNSEFFSGCTLSQQAISASIKGYYPNFCKFEVDSFELVEGNASVRTPTGNQHQVKIHRVDSTYQALHSFYVGTEVVGGVADPFSEQTGSYSYIGGVVGNTADEYPNPNTDSGLNYSFGGATLEFWQTYIGRYMGISGDKVNTFAVSLFSHELEKNNQRRTIKLLHPRYKNIAVNELESLMG